MRLIDQPHLSRWVSGLNDWAADMALGPAVREPEAHVVYGLFDRRRLVCVAALSGLGTSDPILSGVYTIRGRRREGLASLVVSTLAESLPDGLTLTVPIITSPVGRLVLNLPFESRHRVAPVYKID